MTLEMEINRREKAALAQGMMETLNSLVKDGILTLAEAAKRANMSVDAFTKAVAML